jgi:hypothetical protein
MYFERTKVCDACSDCKRRLLQFVLCFGSKCHTLFQFRHSGMKSTNLKPTCLLHYPICLPLGLFAASKRNSYVRSERFEHQRRFYQLYNPKLFPAENVENFYFASRTIGHDYSLAPDAGPSVSTLTENEIHKRLTDRMQYMISRDTERLKIIDGELEGVCVFVDDMAKLWRADGISFNFNSSSKLPNVDERHDYRLSSDAGPSKATISEPDIHNLLAERHYYRRIRDFSNADMIRKDLEVRGVYLDDKNKKWRADGIKFPHFRHNYRMSRNGGPITATIPDTEIHKLLAERHRCKLMQDFEAADRILERLDKCGVSVDDKTMKWRADGIRFSQLRHNYELSAEAGPSRASLSEAEIHKLLAKHWYFKSLNDFDNTDWVSHSLLDAGVFVDEESLEWRADGVRHNYQLSPDAGPCSSSLPETDIHELIEKRMRCRWRQDFKTADRIRLELSDAGVFVDDKKKEWRADGIKYFHYNHRYR